MKFESGQAIKMAVMWTAVQVFAQVLFDGDLSDRRERWAGGLLMLAWIVLVTGAGWWPFKKDEVTATHEDQTRPGRKDLPGS